MAIGEGVAGTGFEVAFEVLSELPTLERDVQS